MKALILDGALGDGTELDRVGDAVRGTLEDVGAGTRTLTLRRMKVRPCRGCFECWVKTPGECVIADEGRDVAREVVAADLVVYLTPLTFGGYSSVLKQAVDRFACPILLPFFIRIDGEVHHPLRYAKPHRLVALGLAGESDAEAEGIFVDLVKRNAVNHHAPTATAAVLPVALPERELRERIGAALSQGALA
jgi:multimeric flavodoxin WrbA